MASEQEVRAEIEDGWRGAPEHLERAITHYRDVGAFEPERRGAPKQIARYIIVLAEAFAEAGSLAADDAVHVTLALSSTPLSQLACTEWCVRLLPLVESARKLVFRKAEPPFTTRDDASAWIEKQAAHDLKQTAKAATEMQLSEYGKRKRRAYADAAWLAQKSGLPYRLTIATPTLVYQRPARLHRPRVDTRGLTERQKAIVAEREQKARSRLPAYEIATLTLIRHDSKLFPLAEASESIAALTGFAPLDVTGWILLGETPTPVRSQVRGRVVVRPGPDGYLVHAPVVSVAFHTPDVRLHDLRELRREIATAWRRLDAAVNPATERRQAHEQGRLAVRELARRKYNQRAKESTEIRPRRKRARQASQRTRISEKDVKLLDIIRELGNPANPSFKFWETVLRRWKQEGYDDVERPESLRKRWYRLKDKPLRTLAKGLPDQTAQAIGMSDSALRHELEQHRKTASESGLHSKSRS